MPPRFAFWTILIDGKPTAFRARDPQELLPTLNQLKRTSSDVVMRWFARGKLWASPEAERETSDGPKPPVEKRNRDWRPGGSHKDPRDRFKKKNRPERAWSPDDVRRDREKLGPPRDRPAAARAFTPAGQDRPGARRPWTPKPPSARPWQTKPSGPRAQREPWRGKPSGAPRGDRPWTSKPAGGAPRGDRKPWQGKPSGKPFGSDPRRRKPKDDEPK